MGKSLHGFKFIYSVSKEGELTFFDWRKSLVGKKVYHDFTWDDPLPLFFMNGFGLKIFKAPWLLYKKLFT